MALPEGLSIGEKYHVFLSFRGPDTREGFADCLFEALQDVGLRVFMDDEELRVGESIGRGIQKAIYDSKLFVPIFSKGFASSKWCLKEIAWMADCLEEFPGKKEMLPVFYDVDASDVKLKTDLYANALLEHEKTSGRETVERWSKALIKVPEVKGWNRRDAKGEGKLIREIREDISRRLELKHIILPDPFIGIKEQVQHIMNALDCGSRDVRFVVIHGMGGIGKTTLASAVFNKICCQYQGCSFLSEVREETKRNGILSLQHRLMRDILRFSSPNFCDVNHAMNCLRGSLRSKDVLVVLDDVSDMDQIKKLLGMGDWVGLGSRVIITTRNLSCIANVEDIENQVTILEGKKIFVYQMRELGFANSLQLLCRHAFGQHEPRPGYEQLSHDILSFTKGIPLAIQVIGSYLKGKSAGIWKEMSNKLRKVPHARLYHEILMSSYETLCDEEKEIFLDIAFFFAGHDKTSAFHYWKARDLSPEMSINTLISYALVKIGCSNGIWMHDLLKDLGREVVRKQSNGNLGMCSRLCNEDAKRLLLKRQGTNHVKALKLDSSHSHNFTPAELSGLSDLTFLELCGGNFVGDFEDCCLSELQWLSWRNCALDFRGTNFYLDNLVMLKLSESTITESWSGWEQFKSARNLKVLELQDLDFTTTPDLSSFLSLERLTFHLCNCLAHIDPSIGNLESVNSLEITNNIDETPSLSLQLPSSIGNMRALSKLEIRFVKLNQLPDSIGDLESLIDLDLSWNKITELPESIGKLRNLTKLAVRKNRLRRLPATIGDLHRLKVLDASFNRDLHGLIPGEFGKLWSLKSLDLSWTGICGFSSTMVQLSRLESLNLWECPELLGLPDLPTCLKDLVISSTIRFSKLKNLAKETSPMPAPYSSTDFVHIDPSISNAECVNSLETTNHPRSPADVRPGESRFHLPSSICNLTAQSRLEIESIKLNRLPENIGKLKGLKFMKVNKCEFLQTLPDSIGDLESLIELDLSVNGITELPQSIGKLRNLTKLDVRKNRLRSLPATIGDLHRLEELDASLNIDLHGEIPGEFGKLWSLKSLNLLWTGICGLPSTIGQLSRLVILKLGNNSDDHDDYGFDQLSQVTDLHLSCPNLLSLPPPGLEELSLYHSASLSCWGRLSYLGSLWSITLCEHIASEIRLDGLESLTNLTNLEISKCEFLERVHGISRLRQLRSLELLDCPKLVEIGGLAQPPASLQVLEVKGCDSILCFPDRLETVSPSELCLEVRNCRKLRDFIGPYDNYNQGGMNPK